MIRCNMTEEERAEFEPAFHRPSTAKLERAKGAFRRYLFYDTWGQKGIREYFCPFCGRFEMGRGDYGILNEDPFLYHHNEIGNCPSCGEEVELKCLGRMRNFHSVEQWGKLLFMREWSGTLIMSAGYASRTFSRDELDPTPEYFETARYAIMPGKRQMWKRLTARSLFGEYKHFWAPMKTFAEPFPRTHYYGMTIKSGEVYVIGAEEISATGMKYCGLIDFAKKAWAVDLLETDGYPAEPIRGAVHYLGEYSRRPQLEMLTKLGHTDTILRLLADGAISPALVNWHAKTPAAFFRLTKPEYNAFRRAGGKLTDIEAWHRYSGMSDAEGAGAWEIGFTDFLHIRMFAGSEAETLFRICGQYKIKPEEAIAYIQEQTPEGAISGAMTIRIWNDYLDMAQKLEREMTHRRNVMPKELQREHDAAIVLLSRLAQTATDGKYGKKRWRQLKRTYAYSDGELSIVIPVNAEVIRAEGRILHHCVGGYADRHIQGKTTILFLRRTEDMDTPYVTIEINDADHVIRQVHGYRNDVGAEAPMIRHRDFFDEWQEWLRRGSPRTKKGEPIRPAMNQPKEEKSA